MDHKFTEKIKQWLETPEDERDYSVGALYLLKLSGNQIMYKNIIAQIDRRHDYVEYQLPRSSPDPRAGRGNGRAGRDHRRRASSD